MFDGLDQFQLQDTTTIQLIFPNGKKAETSTGESDADGNPVVEAMTMTIRRHSSKEVQKFLNKRKNAQITQMKATKNVTAEAMAEDATEMLVFCVAGWSGFRSGGKPVECNRLNVHNLLTDESYVWIREQVDRAAGNDAGYLGNG
jgi:hypothetical protein